MLTKKVSKRKLIKIIGFSALGSMSYGLFNLLSEKKYVKSKWTGIVLNNETELVIHSNKNKNNYLLYGQVSKFVSHVDNIFNLQNPNSEIAILNREKVLTNPSPYLIEVIKKSQIISKNTNGLFDVTVQPLWNFYYNHFIIEGNASHPNINDLEDIKKSINWQNIIIDNNIVKLENDASITLNGIAQGWITDQIIEILKKNNIENTLVDFGETFALGKYENIRPWNILLRGYNNKNKVVQLTNKAVATSSPSGTMFEPSNKYHHIFNPKTGLSKSNYKTVSIISDKAWLSDSLATSALLLDKDKLLPLCNKFKAEAFILDNAEFKKLT